LVKFDYAGDADDFSLERVDPQVSRHIGTRCNESSKGLIRIFSFEIDKSRSKWAGRDGDNQTAHSAFLPTYRTASESLVTGTTHEHFALQRT
jgi:hypothetical protein